MSEDANMGSEEMTPGMIEQLKRAIRDTRAFHRMQDLPPGDDGLESLGALVDPRE